MISFNSSDWLIPISQCYFYIIYIWAYNSGMQIENLVPFTWIGEINWIEIEEKKKLYFISSNYRPTSSPLVNSIVVSSIVGVSMNKKALWIRVGVDDWTAERAIIASNAWSGK